MNPVLRVPVVRPDDSKALFHARSQLENRPAAMDLADNGTDVGGYELVSGWERRRLLRPATPFGHCGPLIDAEPGVVAPVWLSAG